MDKLYFNPLWFCSHPTTSLVWNKQLYFWFLRVNLGILWSLIPNSRRNSCKCELHNNSGFLRLEESNHKNTFSLLSLSPHPHTNWLVNGAQFLNELYLGILLVNNAIISLFWWFMHVYGWLWTERNCCPYHLLFIVRCIRVDIKSARQPSVWLAATPAWWWLHQNYTAYSTSKKLSHVSYQPLSACFSSALSDQHLIIGTGAV